MEGAVEVEARQLLIGQDTMGNKTPPMYASHDTHTLCLMSVCLHNMMIIIIVISILYYNVIFLT